MPPGRPPGTPHHGIRLRDLLCLSLLLPTTASALQQRPHTDELLNGASHTEQQQWHVSLDDSLRSPSHNSGHRGFRDTDVNSNINKHKSAPAHPRDGALATVSSPAENAASGQPPASWSSAPSGITTRLPARSLQDWQVEDIMLLATLDGKLHARVRGTGASLWTLETDREMVETTQHRRQNKTVDENGMEQDDPLFVVEPIQDGAIYMLAPGYGLEKVKYTVRQLAEWSPYASDGYPAVTYTAEKRSTVYTVDAATGTILKTFSPSGSIVNDERSCRKASPLDLESTECETVGTLTLARTEYSVGIQDRNTGEPITTIKYFEWSQNKRDNDLVDEYRGATKDNKYVLSRYDGSVWGKDLALGEQAKPLYRQKFSSPVVRVFDVLRPSTDVSNDPSLLILPQPKFPGSFDQDEEVENVWVDCTEGGNWYAMSETNYPMVTYRAPTALCVGSGSSRGQPVTREIFAGVHFLSADSPDSQGRRQISGQDRLTIDAPFAPPLPYESTTADLAPPKKDANYLPTTVQTILFMLMVCLVGGGFVFKQGSIPWVPKSPLTLPQVPQAVSTIEPGNAEHETTLIREGEPAKETIFPHENSSPSPQVHFEISQEPESPGKHDHNVPDGEEETKEGAEPKKKKATRGKRAGRKQKEKEQAQAEARAKKYGTPLPPAVEVISVDDSESAQVTGSLKINSLVVHTDKMIGQGSCGTIVYEGTFEGRDVAVKRMLSQYYELASQEVSFLQQSDDHPNVVRYFCQQKDDHFLYIAVELCQASLFEVWEAEKAKTEERQRQLRTLKVAMQQDMSRTLQQLAAGLFHLHNLRIIHRDIKPQNILVAFPKRTQPHATRLVISDFGLGKNLPENVSTLVDATGNAGTSGWKAPELISQPRETASNNTHSTSNGSDIGNGGFSGVKRAADIFSLGCLFFWVLTDGVHPFEDENGWQQLRELNIKRDKKNMEALERWSDAYEPVQLISSMLAHLPEQRPTAQQVLNHPYFWSPEKRLAFLCDVSDHFEREPRGTYEDNYLGDSDHLRLLEDRVEEIIGEPLDRADFLLKLDRQFVDTLGKQRKYSGYRVLDLLRALRNKKNHYEDMPENIKKLVGPLAGGYLGYWSIKFPRLLMSCYEVVHEAKLQDNDRFKGYFALGSNNL